MPSLHNSRDAMPYRDCVGIVLFNRQGQVFVGKRAPGKNGEHTHAWQFPQGGIDKGEEPLQAAMRELREETSVTTTSLLSAAPQWIFYDLPDELLGTALKGKYRGQRQKWFAFLLEGDETEINVTSPCNGAHPAEFTSWRWVDIDAVLDLIVPFKRDAYAQVVSAFSSVPARLQAIEN